MAVAVATFLIALALIASERLHRTKVALLGAAIVVLFVPGFGQETAIESIDFNTIGLLAGMMILVYLTQQTGVYDYIAIRAGQLSRGEPLRVVLSLACTTALLSAFLDNLTTVLLVVPITFLLADALDIDPIPLIVIEVMASNIGGTATLIGDPPNIIIAGATGLTFNEFIVNLAPIVVVTLRGRDRRPLRLSTGAGSRSRRRTACCVMELDAAASIRDCDGAAAHRPGPRPDRPRVLRPPGARRSSPRPWRSPARRSALLVTPDPARAGAREDRVADPVLLRGAVRDGRRARGRRARSATSPTPSRT